MLIVVLMLAGGQREAQAASTSPPPSSFMFAASQFPDKSERDAIRSILQTYVTSRDYLSLRLIQQFPELNNRVARSHQFVLPTSLYSARKEIEKGCGPNTPGLIIYDGEHWPNTPANEQMQMQATIDIAQKIVATNSCHDYAIAPDAEFIGISPKTCSYNLSAAVRPGSLGAAVRPSSSWSSISLIDIQAQILLAQKCSLTAGVDNYVKFVTAFVENVRAKTDHPSIIAQLSFRHTPPATMVSAIRKLTGIVDGFYMAYPANQEGPCEYCAPVNLETVLRALRGAQP